MEQNNCHQSNIYVYEYEYIYVTVNWEVDRQQQPQYQQQNREIDHSNINDDDNNDYGMEKRKTNTQYVTNARTNKFYEIASKTTPPPTTQTETHILWIEKKKREK